MDRFKLGCIMSPRELSVSRASIQFSKPGQMVAAVALIGSALLSGCSGRDTAAAEKLAATNAAAERAEKAAVRAEAADEAAAQDAFGVRRVVESAGLARRDTFFSGVKNYADIAVDQGEAGWRGLAGRADTGQTCPIRWF